MAEERFIDLDNPEQNPPEYLEGLRGAILHTLKSRYGITIEDGQAVIPPGRMFSDDEREDIKLALGDLEAVERAINEAKRH